MVDGGGSGLRQRRKLQTKREIARAALDLVLARGLADVTVEDIAAAAGVSARTFFNYFTSKRSAVVPGPEPLSPDVIERFVADQETPVLDGLFELIKSHLADWPDVRQQMQCAHVLVTTYPELMTVLHERVAEFERVLVDAVARRLDAPEGDRRPRVAAALVGALVKASFMGRADEGGDPLDDLDACEAALRSLLIGSCPEGSPGHRPAQRKSPE
jgi:AcrR family transcriptional regulator